MTTPDRTALLLVDVQNDFCPGGALAVPDGDRVVPVLNRYLSEAAERGWPVYASRDWHPRDTSHFKEFGGEWPPHCIQESAGARFHAALRLPRSAIVISKGQSPDRPGYSAFEGVAADGTPFEADLRARKVTHLYVGGLATDYCVKASVLDALRAGFAVTVIGDAVRGVEVERGDSEKAMAAMKNAGATIVASIDSPLRSR